MPRIPEKYIVLDTETANSQIEPLVYDIGFIVTDRKGKIYEKYSLCISDIFTYRPELMQSAYYAKKVPLYYEQIKKGAYEIVSFSHARFLIIDVMKKYNITKVYAYNITFDRTALNMSQRYITKSKYRYFFPYGTEFFDIWNFACNTICQKKSYKKFCEDNGYISNKGKNYKSSAEVVYAYIINSNTYQELHQGLEDVYIENAILQECLRMHKKVVTNIYRLCWKNVARE